MDSFKKRLEAIIKEYNIGSGSRFAEEIGHKQPEKILRLLRDEKNNPSLDIIKDIANRFANISLEWLIMGKGDMHSLNPNISKEDVNTIRELKERIKELQEDKKELIKDKEWYKNELEQIRANQNGSSNKQSTKQSTKYP